MNCYRACKNKYADTAFTGVGSRQHSGRWHNAGTEVVYTASSLSLVILESLVHFDRQFAPPNYVYFEIEIPDGVELRYTTAAELGRNWRRYPSTRKSRDLGSRWARECATVGLVVPSAIVPEEHNILLNPNHADFAKLRVGPKQALRFDKRLLET